MSDEEAAHVVELVQVAVEQESNRDAWPRFRAHHWNAFRLARERRVHGTTIHRQLRRFALTAPDKLE